MDLDDIVGSIGVLLVLLSYILLQFDRIKHNELSYSLINFIGAACILYSLLFKFNLPSFIIEVVWLVISFFGICKYFYLTKLKKLNNIK